MSSEIDKILNIFENKIPECFDNEKPTRLSQVQMSLDITEFLYNSSKNIMFIEAPVGTGKSLGVLVPSILYVTKQEKAITYATSTINLQNQIFETDSAILEKIDILKNNEKIFALGKSNYTCKTVYIENINSFSELEKKQLENYFNSCKYGYVSELEEMYPNINNKIKKHLLMSSLREECFGFCPGHNHRYKYRDRRNKLIITNHDQQIQTSLNVKAERKEIIPNNPGVIIFDEAHTLKENYLGRLESSVSYNSLKNLKIKKNRTEYDRLIFRLKNLKSKYVKSNFESSMRYKVQDEDLEVIKSIKDIIESNVIENIMVERYSSSSHSSSDLENVLTHLTAFINIDKYTSWLQFDNNVELHYVSNHFNQAFKEFINSISKYNKVIFLSGTLTSGEPKNEFQINWGLNDTRYTYKKYSNIFDLEKQAIVYVPKELSHPSHSPDAHLSEVIDNLTGILALSSGGSLILCTSNEHVDTISNSIKTNSKISQTVYTQGESSVSILSEKFKNNESSILVGSGSFFSGFSVEGRSLDKVILSKLPYPVPTDPYIELISSGHNNQEIYDLFIKPMMLKKLEQGLGRLIRSNTDYGILTIFDSRIWNNQDILHFFSKHNYRLTSNLDDIKKFMDQASYKSIQIDFQKYSRSHLKIPAFTMTRSISSFSEERKNLKNYTIQNNEDISIYTDWLKDFIKENKKKNKNPNHIIQYTRLKSAKDVYQNAVNFCYKKQLPFDLIKDSFPYSSMRQKENFNRVKPTVAAPVTVMRIEDLHTKK